MSRSFEYCTNITQLTLGNQLKAINEYSFSHCVSLLGSLVIPNSVETIGESAFSGCTSLIHIFIPSSVKTIGINAFNQTKSLKLISIPKNVFNENIGIDNQAKIISNEDESISLYKYGKEFRYGYRVSINKREAAKYYKMSADKGNDVAMKKYMEIRHKGYWKWKKI